MSSDLDDIPLQRILDAEQGEVIRLFGEETSDTPNVSQRDSVVIDLVKNNLAYSGYSSQSLPGVSVSYTDQRNRLLRRLESPLVI